MPLISRPLQFAIFSQSFAKLNVESPWRVLAFFNEKKDINHVINPNCLHFMHSLYFGFTFWFRICQSSVHIFYFYLFFRNCHCLKQIEEKKKLKPRLVFGCHGSVININHLQWTHWFENFCFSANEKRAFLLYYSIPLLSERLNETCLLHLAFLVGGVYRLLKESISKIDLEEAGVFLKVYCAQAPFFYGEHCW